MNIKAYFLQNNLIEQLEIPTNVNKYLNLQPLKAIKAFITIGNIVFNQRVKFEWIDNLEIGR